MKTSFAQTMCDLSNNEESRDRIYTDRETERIIQDENNQKLQPEEVFVIKPYEADYESPKLSTLLVNKELKKEYDEILAEIEIKKEALLIELKKTSGLKTEVEEAVSQVFTKEKNKFLVALGRIENEILYEEKNDLEKISYNKIFNDKVEDFLNTKGFKEKLAEYTKIYDQILSNSTFFKKGIFNHYQASEIAKNLKSHGFFKAEHSVYVNSDTQKKEITTEKQLEDLIQKEKETILSSTDLQKSFEEIDKKLKNEDLRSFREYLLNNQDILPELSNLELFKEKLWKSYLVTHIELFKALMDVYNKGKKRIQEITDEASKQATRWQEVINIFNRRFSVPFKVAIENKQDVILNRVSPNIQFQFQENGDSPRPIERNKLVEVLSNGEKRALYILNIIFEVEARKEEHQKTLFVIDDIADSFDYKNKYAIIEYLNDILHEGDFYQIILTHNYDFFRTVSGRLQLWGYNYNTIKSKDGIKFVKAEHYNNPFKKWIKNLDVDEKLIASIPFVRNLAEFCGHDEHETKLTSLLHVKPDTHTLKVIDLQNIYREILHNKADLVLTNPQKNIIDLIFEVAEKISQDTEMEVELEKKIILSIAIRLKTEEFLIKKINDNIFVNELKNNQTLRLVEKYKSLFKNTPAEQENIKTIERVNLMTPENIHINSFMYEPILDMSNEHLKNLYQEIQALRA